MALDLHVDISIFASTFIWPLWIFFTLFSLFHHFCWYWQMLTIFLTFMNNYHIFFISLKIWLLFRKDYHCDWTFIFTYIFDFDFHLTVTVLYECLSHFLYYFTNFAHIQISFTGHSCKSVTLTFIWPLSFMNNCLNSFIISLKIWLSFTQD